MASIYLFRIKAIKAPLFNAKMTPAGLLSEIIINKPSSELRRGYIWHIGNVKQINDEGYIFAAGRTTKKARHSMMKKQGIF